MTEPGEPRPPSGPRDIAIVGLAAWYPCGGSLTEFWGNVLARRRAFRRIPERRLAHEGYFDNDPLAPDTTYLERAALIDGFVFDWAGRRVPKQVFDTGDLVQWLALEVALRAIDDAGYNKDRLPRETTGVIVGNTLTGEVSRANGLRLRWPYVARSMRVTAAALGWSKAAIEELLGAAEEVFKSAFPPITEDTLPGVIPNTIAGRICNYLDLKGGGYAVDGACSSSAIAVARAADALVAGQLDVALAGGVDISIDPFEVVGFAKLGALAKDEMYVYDEKSQGFFPGEGCGWVMLKRLEDARRDGDYIYATLRGWGISSDGRGGLTAPSEEGQAIAIRRACAMAGYALSEVDFIEGHGTGTTVGDMTELRALARVLKDDPRAKPRGLGVTALKSLIGHTKAAAGIGSLIKTILAVNQRIIPPLAGCKQRHPVFEQSGTQLFPLVDGEVRTPSSTLRGGVSSFGFGGINVHLTIESAGPAKAALATSVAPRALFVSYQENEVFFFGADSPDALRAAITPLVSAASGISLAEMADLAADSASRIDPRSKLRAAVVASNPEDLARKLETVLYMLRASPAAGALQVDPLRDVWLGNAVERRRIGFAYPGQGSQLLSMARALVERHGWAQDLVARADRWVHEIGGFTLSEHVFRRAHRARDLAELERWQQQLTETRVCQPAICLASLLWTRYLDQLGIRPDIVGGHSLGELSAFQAAGGIEEQELFYLAAHRGIAMSAEGAEAGSMASLRCSREEAEELLARDQGYAVIANINSASQVVVSGAPAAIDRLIEEANKGRVSAQRLSVSNAFHSKYVAAGAEALRQKMRFPRPLGALSARLISGIGGREVTPGIDLSEHFASQIVSPVDFVGVSRHLAGGAELLIEVGPGRVLSGLLNSAVAEKGPLCLPIEAEAEDARSLNRVLAAFFVRGGQVDFKTLFAERLIAPFVAPAEKIFVENPCERDLSVESVALGRNAPAVAGELEALFAERTGLSAEVIAGYVERRGTFLADIVSADLKTSPLPSAVAAPAEQGAKPPSAKKSVAPKGHGSGAAAHAEIDLEQVLIDLVMQRTGFPRESIKPEMTLLNDLNLESIAAGDIIARAARAAGVTSQASPANLLQSSIKKVAEALQAAKNGAAPKDQRPLAGLDSKRGLLDALAKLSGRSSWVRRFSIEHPVTPLIKKSAAGHPPLLGVVARIVCPTAGRARAEGLRLGLNAAGAKAEIVDLAVLEQPDAVAGVGLWVGVLPELTAETPLSAAQLSAELLHLKQVALAIQNPAPRSANGGPSDEAAPALVLINAGDGAFGLGAALTDGRSQPLTSASFAASIHLERPGLKVRALDLAPQLSPEVAGQLLVAELATGEKFESVGYDAAGVRRVARPVLVPAGSSKNPRRARWSASDVVLVSGGGKGVTAELAFRFAEASGAKMALLGRTAGPKAGVDADGEVVATLKRFEEAGLVARYVSADVIDGASVERAIREVGAELGPITGVIHGAGVNNPARLGAELPGDAEKTVGAKVLGLTNILRGLDAAGMRPKLVAGISSIIGFTGMHGNSWYALANEWMEACLRDHQRRHPELECFPISFSLIGEAGMAKKLAGVEEGLKQAGTSAIPLQHAVSEFLDLLARDSGGRRLIVAARLGGLDTWRPPVTRLEGHRFLTEVLTVQPGVELVARAKLTLDQDPYLRDHIYKKSILFPTVFGIEAMGQALAQLLSRPQLFRVRIEGLDLARPILVDPERGTSILIHAEVLSETQPGQLSVRIGIASEETDFGTDHFAATLVVPSDPLAELFPGESARSLTIARPAKPLDLHPIEDFYGRYLFHGPMFQRLREFYLLRSNYAVFRAEQNLAGAPILGDPFFRDALLQAGQVVISQDRALPRWIERIDLFADHGKTTLPLVEGVLDERTREHVDCTITVTDGAGRVIQRLEGCRFAIVEHLKDEPTAEEIAAPNGRDQRLLLEHLNAASSALSIRLPSVALADLPGVSALPAKLRHERERTVLSDAVRAADQPSQPSRPSQPSSPSGK